VMSGPLERGCSVMVAAVVLRRVAVSL
jgi:hypothetical protein